MLNVLIGTYVITYAVQQTANHLLSLVVKMFQFNNLETNMQKNLQINFSKITAGCLRLKLLSLDFHITIFTRGNGELRLSQ